MKNYYIYKNKFGQLYILSEASYIIGVYLNPQSLNLSHYFKAENQLIKKTYYEIEEFLRGERTSFNIPIKIKTSDFQRSVLELTLKVNYGESSNYKTIARKLGNPSASRAVGNALGKNPLLFLIPCHRIVRSDGGLSGYSGGLKLKKYLLEMEKNRLV